MMTLFDLMQFAGKLPGLKRFVDVKSRIMEETVYEANEVVGSFDNMERLPGRLLEDVLPEEEREVQSLGAVKAWHLPYAKFETIQADGIGMPSSDDEWLEMGAVKNWRVPDSIQVLEPFKPWFPKVPHDLAYKQIETSTTKSGEQIYGYVLSQDSLSGSESSVMPMFLGMLTVISCVALMAWFVLPGMLGTLASLAILACAYPYLISIKQEDGGKKALGAAVFALFLPFLLSVARLKASGIPGGAAVAGNALAANALSDPSTALIGAGTALGGFVSISIFIAAFYAIIWGGAGWNGKILAFKRALKLEIYLVVFLAVFLYMPFPVNIIFVYAVACLCPLVYIKRLDLNRDVILTQNGNDNSMGDYDLADKNRRRDLREQQAKDAMKDKTPFIALGKPTGYLHLKDYRHAATGDVMGLTVLDNSKHKLTTGQVGSGKTYIARKEMADVKCARVRVPLNRPTILHVTEDVCLESQQFIETRIGGLVADAKNVLVAEMGRIIDKAIRPGIDFALCEDLNPSEFVQSIKEALDKNTSTNKDGANGIWDKAANMVYDHALTIVYALYKSEIFTRENSAKQLSELQQGLIRLEVDRALYPQERDAFDQTIARVEKNIGLLEAHLRTERDCHWIVDNHQRFIEKLNAIRVVGGVPKLDAYVRGAFVAIIKSGYLDVATNSAQITGSIAYFENEWAPMAPETRTSITFNLAVMIQALFRGEHLKNEHGVPWTAIEKGVDLRGVLYGDWVGVDLPTDIHGFAGEMVAELVKQRVFRYVKMRPNNWLEIGQSFIYYFLDEAHLMVGQSDRKLISTSRSKGFSFNLYTQNIYSFFNALGESQAKEFLANFSNNVCFFNAASPETYGYYRNLLGKERLTNFKTAPVGINYLAQSRSYAASPLHDRHHPRYKEMQELRLMGVGKIQNAGASGEKSTFHNNSMDSDVSFTSYEEIKQIQGFRLQKTSGKQLEDVLSEDDFSKNLFRGRALIILNRAGSLKADFCEVSGLDFDEVDDYLEKRGYGKAA